MSTFVAVALLAGAQWIASSNSFNSALLWPSITSILSSGIELSFQSSTRTLKLKA
jgi:hypothetical protein